MDGSLHFDTWALWLLYSVWCPLKPILVQINIFPYVGFVQVVCVRSMVSELEADVESVC